MEIIVEVIIIVLLAWVLHLLAFYYLGFPVAKVKVQGDLSRLRSELTAKLGPYIIAEGIRDLWVQGEYSDALAEIYKQPMRSLIKLNFIRFRFDENSRIEVMAFWVFRHKKHDTLKVADKWLKLTNNQAKALIESCNME